MKKFLLALMILSPAVVHATWKYDVLTDDFTDESTYITATPSENGGALFVVCDENKSFRIGFRTPVAMFDVGGGTQLRYRIGKGEIVNNLIGVTIDSSTMVLFAEFTGEKEFNTLLTGLLSGSSIVVEIRSPLDQQWRRDKFSLTGSSAQISKVRSNCKG